MGRITSRNSKRSKVSPKSTLLITRIFLIVGAIAFSVGAIGLVKAKDSVNWPNVSGKVVSSSVESHRSSGSGSSSSTTYGAEILYEYEVDGVVYNGNRVAYGDYNSSNPSHARSIVNRYPKDKQVMVYFKPDDPDECVLETGIKMQVLFIPGLGLAFMLVGFWWAKSLKKQIAEQENNPENIDV